MPRIEIVPSQLALPAASDCSCDAVSGISGCIDDIDLVAASASVFKQARESFFSFSDPSDEGISLEILRRRNQTSYEPYTPSAFSVLFQYDSNDARKFAAELANRLRLGGNRGNTKKMFEQFLAGARDRNFAWQVVNLIPPEDVAGLLWGLEDPVSFGRIIGSANIRDAAYFMEGVSPDTAIYLLRGIPNVARGARILFAIETVISRRQWSHLEKRCLTVPLFEPRETAAIYRARMLAVMLSQIEESGLDPVARNELLTGLESFFNSRRSAEDARRIFEYSDRFGCYIGFDRSLRRIVDMTCSKDEEWPAIKGSDVVVEGAAMWSSPSADGSPDALFKEAFLRLLRRGLIPSEPATYADLKKWAEGAKEAFEDVVAEGDPLRNSASLKGIHVGNTYLSFFHNRELYNVSIVEKRDELIVVGNWNFRRDDGKAVNESVSAIMEPYTFAWGADKEGNGQLRLLNFKTGETRIIPNRSSVKNPADDLARFFKENRVQIR